MTTSTGSVAAAAAALASALPASATLTAGQPVAAAQVSEALLPIDAGAALTARVGAAPGSQATGELVVVVHSELVQALATSPMGPLDLAAAVQPALDAASHAATGGPASPAQQGDIEAAVTNALERPGAQVVALADPQGVVAATLILVLDEVGGESPAFVPNASPAPAAETPSLNTLPAAEVRLPRQSGGGAGARPGAASSAGLDLLRDVAMEITVELGRTRMTVRELLSLTPGAVIELDRAAGSPADLLVNGTLIARGEVVVVDEDFGIRITEIMATGDVAGPSATAGLGAA